MKERKIDFEKDYLVIFRGKEGKFAYFCWYSPFSLTLEQLQEKIEKFNNQQKEKQTAEYITDQLIREICTYTEYAKPFEEILEQLEELKEIIEVAKGSLDTAMNYLNRIGVEE